VVPDDPALRVRSVHSVRVQGLLVRRAVESDASSIRGVIERSIRYSAADVYTPAQIDAWAGGGSRQGVVTMIHTTVAFVAEANGRVVGFTNLVGADVDQLYVDPEFGSRGVARRLYEAAEAAARGRGIHGLTASASLRAVPVFERFGFVEEARVDRSFNGESFSVVAMMKDLVLGSSRLPDVTPRLRPGFALGQPDVHHFVVVDDHDEPAWEKGHVAEALCGTTIVSVERRPLWKASSEPCRHGSKVFDTLGAEER
jgi:putative acetyltransferase